MTETSLPPSLSLPSHFLGRLCDELSDLIERQSATLFEQEGLVIPVRSCSLMAALARTEPVSAASLADALGRSHQLVSQKLPKLVKLGLIEAQPDPEDARRKLYRLTPYGREQMALFVRLQPMLDRGYAELFAQVGDGAEMIRTTIRALLEKPLHERAAR